MKALALALVALTACGGGAAFRLSSDENNAFALNEALAKRQLPPSPQPNSGSPRVFAVAAGAGASKQVVAFDLAANKPLWKVDAAIDSRIAVGGDFIVALEGKELVARDGKTGAPRWHTGVSGTFVGAAADRERAYLVTRDGNTGYLAAYDGGSGSRLWRESADGALGAPAAHGGVVYVPFLSQWLAIVDGKSGKQLTRLRGLDDQISMLRVSSDTAYFGSKRGVFRLDARAASGKRQDATYGKVPIPASLDRASYGRDMYDPAQAGYTAFDRARVWWAAAPSDSGPMKLAGDGYAIHYFRFVFGFDAAGDLRWAYSQPRVELVASDDTGAAIVAVSSAGEVVALDVQTGAVRGRANLGTTTPVLGATFDADGWSPSGAGEQGDLVAVLSAIARDHDARFDRVKELAVDGLAKRPGAAVTTELLAVLADSRAPQKLKDRVADLLAARKDPASLPVLTAQLATHTDYLAKTEPESLNAVAKAMAGLGEAKLDAKDAAAALAALQSHLDAPSTSAADLAQVIDAMAAIGHGAERAALWAHLLLYHADDELGADAAWDKAIVRALDGKGPAERELLRWVAADPRTKGSLSGAIKDALGN